jgi:hypothetical protein
LAIKKGSKKEVLCILKNGPRNGKSEHGRRDDKKGKVLRRWDKMKPRTQKGSGMDNPSIGRQKAPLPLGQQRKEGSK